ELREVFFNGGLGLGDGHAGHIDAAVRAEADDAVGVYQMLAADLLHGARLEEQYLDFEILQLEALELLLDSRLGLFKSHASDIYPAVVDTKIDSAVCIHRRVAGDRIFGQVRNIDNQNVQGTDPVRRLRDKAHCVEQQNIGRLDHV